MIEAATRRGQALAAAIDLGIRLGVTCDKARILKDSNNTIVHLAPSPIVAKVGTSTIRPDARSLLEKELRIGTYLAERGAPIVPPAEMVPVGPHLQNGVEITLWTYMEPTDGAKVTDAALGEMLTQFHKAFAGYLEHLPSFTEDLSRAQAGLQNRTKTSALSDGDRAFLLEAAAEIRDALQGREVEEHPLHGDPHLDGNVLVSDRGPVLVDFEGACVGPHEWDLTALGRALAAYPHADRELLTLLGRMRSLCVATWCWMQYQRAPEVTEAAHVHLAFLRGDEVD